MPIDPSSPSSAAEHQRMNALLDAALAVLKDGLIRARHDDPGLFDQAIPAITEGRVRLELVIALTGPPSVSARVSDSDGLLVATLFNVLPGAGFALPATLGLQ